MKILKLTIKKQWFDMIYSGEKKYEYREIKQYWINRFAGKKYDAIHFFNGACFSEKLSNFIIELKGTFLGFGLIKWGAVPKELYFCLKLGKILKKLQKN